MDSEKDKKVKKIARFLELGGTMLAQPCKACGAPMFRYQGRIICPICDVRDEEEPEVPIPQKVPQPAPGSAPEPAAELEPEARPYSPKTEKAQLPPQKIRYEPKSRVSHVQPPREEIKKPVTEETEIKRPVPEETEIPPARELLEKPETIEALSGDWTLLEDLILKKLVNIADSLQNEKDTRRISEAFELIEKGLNLINRLKRN